MFGIGQQGQAEEKKGGIFGGGAPAQAHPAKPGSSWLPQCTVAVLSSSSHQDEAATGRSCVSALFAKVQYEVRGAATPNDPRTRPRTGAYQRAAAVLTSLPSSPSCRRRGRVK